MSYFLDEADEVLAGIKEMYLENRREVTIDRIYKRFKGFEDVKYVLKFLQSKKLIRSGSLYGSWVPVFVEGEIEKIELEKTSKVTFEKIVGCIRYFFKEHGVYPLSSEIRETFEKLYGVSNMIDIPRQCRRWATEEPVMLARTADNRYMPLKIPYMRKPLTKYLEPRPFKEILGA